MLANSEQRQSGLSIADELGALFGVETLQRRQLDRVGPPAREQAERKLDPASGRGCRPPASSAPRARATLPRIADRS